MTSTAAFIARLVGVLAAAVATLAVAVGVLGTPGPQADKSDATLQVEPDSVSKH
jgi:hypothetical protein